MVLHLPLVDASVVYSRLVSQNDVAAKRQMLTVVIVTITAIAENWSNLPFDRQWRLFVSDVTYNIEVRG